MNSILRFPALLISVVLLLPWSASAQSHFTECASVTGDDATLVVTTAIAPTIDGNAIAIGDEIAVFTPAGTCAGVGVWTGSNLGITIWGDDVITDGTVEGFVGGETLHFRIWDASASQEYGGSFGAVTVTYESSSILNSSGLYASNAIYELASLTAVPAPAAPNLSSPSDGATDVEMPVSLSWSAVTGGHSYDVQVATSSDFQNLQHSQTGVIGTSHSVSGLGVDQTYFWRVRAVNSSGVAGAYSTAFSFTTLANAPDVPVLASPADGAINVSLSPTVTWESVVDADSYELQVSTAADFGSVDVLDETGITGTSHALSGLSNGEVYHWRVRAVNSGVGGSWSAAYTFTTIATQTVALASGWNMVSSYVEPVDPSLEGILSPLGSSLVLVKDGSGNVYWPEQNLTSISTWEASVGYIVYVTESTSFVVSGAEIQADETSISLNSGWNSVAYWGRSSMDVSQALESIATAVVAVKNVSGEVYLPSESVDMLGTLDPGAGYMMYLDQNATLTYPASVSKSGASSAQGPGLAASATIVVNVPMLADGDVVVARIGSREIGRAAVSEGRAVVVLKGDDPLTEGIDGAVDGEPVTLTRSDALVEEPLAVSEIRDVLTSASAESSALTYRENAIWTVYADGGDVPAEYTLEGNYPNPFNPATTIRYALSDGAETTLSVYNMLGQQVAVLVDQYQEAGSYEIRFDAEDLPSGNYIYRLESGEFTQHRQMILSK